MTPLSLSNFAPHVKMQMLTPFPTLAKNQGDVPTVRAVNERVLKLRNVSKSHLGLVGAVKPSDPNNGPSSTTDPSATTGFENVAAHHSVDSTTATFENLATQASFSAINTGASAKRQRRTVKTEQATEGRVASVTGKRKRGAGVVGGIARMSKTGVYELGEPSMMTRSENSFVMPGAKKLKTLEVKGEDGNIELDIITKGKLSTVDELE